MLASSITRSLALASTAIAICAFAPVAAQAQTLASGLVLSPSGSFDDALIGTITLPGLSDVSGNAWAAATMTFSSSAVFSLDAVTYTGFSLLNASTNAVVSTSLSSSSFFFDNVPTGTYKLVADGFLTPTAAPKPWHKASLLLANHQVVAAVPEPETYAMFLAGLCVVGAAARRRQQR